LLTLPGFARGTDPSPGLGLSLVEYLRMTNLEIPGNECGNAKEEKRLPDDEHRAYWRLRRSCDCNFCSRGRISHGDPHVLGIERLATLRNVARGKKECSTLQSLNETSQLGFFRDIHQFGVISDKRDGFTFGQCQIQAVVHRMVELNRKGKSSTGYF
jgi:hypothetical protein